MSTFFYKLTFFFVIISSKGNAQLLKTRPYCLKEFGRFVIPVELDTLSDRISKIAYLDNFFENSNKEGIKKIDAEFNTNIVKGVLSNLDSNTIVFWPTKTVLKLLKINSLDTNANRDLELLPSVMIRKNLSKFNSAQVKKYLEDKNKLNEFKKTLTESYSEGIKSIFPNCEIKSIKSEYILFQNLYPYFKISTKFVLKSDNKFLEFTQDLYTMNRKDKEYLFKFEFRDSDATIWKDYQVDFFKNIILND